MSETYEERTSLKVEPLVIPKAADSTGLPSPNSLVHVTLSWDEAVILRHVLGHIGGPMHGARGQTDNIRGALIAALGPDPRCNFSLALVPNKSELYFA